MSDRGRTVTPTRSWLSEAAPTVGSVGSRGSPIDRILAVGLPRPDPLEDAALLLVDSHLHSNDDSICPRCLTWIEERHYVRRNGYGLLQHEVCPS